MYYIFVIVIEIFIVLKPVIILTAIIKTKYSWLIFKDSKLFSYLIVRERIASCLILVTTMTM